MDQSQFPTKNCEIPANYPNNFANSQLNCEISQTSKSRIYDTKWPRNGCLWSLGTLAKCWINNAQKLSQYFFRISVYCTGRFKTSMWALRTPISGIWEWIPLAGDACPRIGKLNALFHYLSFYKLNYSSCFIKKKLGKIFPSMPVTFLSIIPVNSMCSRKSPI